jgi:drug/metabolite transporter (DMT)-like permease
MNGALWALAAGAGFGLFQSFNRQAVRGMNVYVATFVQLAVSALILSTIAVLTEDLNPLFTAPLRAHLYFVAAGFFHFLIGWTFLNASQKKIGAARTSPLIGTNPLFATVIAAVTLHEIPSLLELAGVGIIVWGAYLVSSENLDVGNVNGNSRSLSSILQTSWLGLSAAFFWAVSPIFIRLGLQDLPSPLLGVTIGVTASALAYGSS